MAHTNGPKGTMCGTFFPSALGCVGGKPLSDQFIEATHFDSPIQVFLADADDASKKLLVYFHGHGGTPLGDTEFLTFAADHGYDVVTLDYDYSRDYVAARNPIPLDADCGAGNDTCPMSVDAVCGCYADCYGDRNKLAWLGGDHPGLASVDTSWSVDTRLRRVIQYMVAHADKAHPGFSRFGSYLDGNQRDGINWSVTTVAGHSLGSDLAGYIGKWQSVDRVIVMSGPAGKLAPDSNDTINWGTAFGCSNDLSSGCGVGTAFAGCHCENTTYRFGVANDLDVCSLSSQPIGWVADNNFGTNTGVNWQTKTNRIYGFVDASDHIANWIAPLTISTHRNWLSINLDARHDSGFSDGWNQVGTFLSPLGPQAGDWHGVLSGTDPWFGQICNGASGHNAVIVDSACDGDSSATANRFAVWEFLLTH
jgi:hypothetical protein